MLVHLSVSFRAHGMNSPATKPGPEVPFTMQNAVSRTRWTRFCQVCSKQGERLLLCDDCEPERDENKVRVCVHSSH